MKAIRVHEFGGPEVLKLEDVPDLQPGPGQVVGSCRRRKSGGELHAHRDLRHQACASLHAGRRCRGSCRSGGRRSNQRKARRSRVYVGFAEWHLC